MIYRKVIILSVILFHLTGFAGWSQPYKWAAGVKISKQMGLSVVYSPEMPYSFEGAISKNMWSNESGLSLTGRYHQKLLTRGINFYGGGGFYYGMYDNPELSSFSALLLTGGAEITLGKANFSFNISPLIGAGNEEMKFRIGSDVTIRHIFEKHPRKKLGILEKMGLKKKQKKSGKTVKNKKSADRKKLPADGRKKKK